MKGLTMAQWINPNRNNRSVIASIPFVVRKTGPILPPLVGLTAGWLAGRLADEIRVDFEIFKILYWLNYSDDYFV